MVAPDQTTFDYLQGRTMAPAGDNWKKAVSYWRTLQTDEGASFDTLVEVNAAEIEPSVTWGTNPGMVIGIRDRVPNDASAGTQEALQYMQLQGGSEISGQPVNMVFIGSCTNSRISDLRSAASIFAGRKVAAGTRVMIVAGSEATKKQAEAEGLHRIFIDAGAEWREPGCSMCIGMNGDIGQPGDLVVSTSNRNFKGRQGRDVRTILASPLTAAACAVTGHITDPRTLLPESAHSTMEARA